MSKERPILFSGPMVRALLEGRKTQTRRIAVSGNPLTKEQIRLGFDYDKTGNHWRCDCPVKGLPRLHVPVRHPDDRKALSFEDCGCNTFYCRHGEPGDRLWVKETWQCAVVGNEWKGIGYRASYASNHDWCRVTEGKWSDETREQWHQKWAKYQDKWRPSIFMPRWASRITIEITSVRVERLQDISHKDALAEGVEYDVSKPDGAPLCRYQKLWESINGKGSWDANPWVWVIEFKRVQPRSCFPNETPTRR